MIEQKCHAESARPTRVNWKHTRRSRTRYPLVVTISLLIVLTSFLALTVPSAAAQSVGGPDRPVGDFVAFTCSHGAVKLSGTLVCHDQSDVQVGVCGSPSYCTYTLSATMDTGYTFSDWTSSGNSCLGTYPTCGTSSYTNPTPYWGPGGGMYTGQLTLNGQVQPPPTCNPPAITGLTIHKQTVNGIDRQVWIDWTFTGTAPVLPGFSWNPSGQGQLPTPEYNSTGSSANISLNALNAGTTYDFTIYANNCYGNAQENSYFTTASAPTNEFVGWISSFTQNGYQLDQLGNPVPGATIDSIWATCTNPNGAPVRVPFPSTDQVGGITLLPAATADSNGGYVVSFPLSFTEQPNGYVLYQLLQNGVCNDETYPGGQGDFTNTYLTLNASSPGYYSAGEFISSTNSVTNDYHEFGLLRNVVQSVPVGTAFIHGTNFAECGFTYWTQSATSTVTQDIGINTYSGSNIVSTSQQLWNSPGGWGVNNALNLLTPFTGTVNETSSQATFSSLGAVSPIQGPDANPVTTSDGVTLISTPPNQQLPAGWNQARPNSGQTQSNPLTEITYTQGTYESTSGISDSLSFSVGWEGYSASTQVSILATTTISTSLGSTASCGFAYPGTDSNGGSPYFYYHTTEPTDSSVYAPIVDVWFVGYCGGRGGEPAC